MPGKKSGLSPIIEREIIASMLRAWASGTGEIRCPDCRRLIPFTLYRGEGRVSVAADCCHSQCSFNISRVLLIKA